MPPVLQTQRLILRGHTLDDFVGCSRLWTNPDVTRFIGGRPSTQEEVWSRILRYAGHWQLLGFGYFVGVDRQSNEIVGEFGLANFHRDIDPPFGDTPEAGWAMLPDYHGKGLAREAMEAVLTYADSKRIPKTVCMIDPANAASIRLAETLGFREYARTTYQKHSSILFERPAPDAA